LQPPFFIGLMTMRMTRTDNTHTRSIRFWRLGLAGLGLLAIAGCASFFGPRTVDITREELQAKLAQRFPMSRRVLNMFDVARAQGMQIHTDRLARRLNMPVVTAVSADTNRVTADVDLLAKDTSSGRDYIGNVGVSFGLRYEPKDQTLRILALNVDRINIQGMPSGFQQMLMDLGNKIAREQLHDYPIHQFKPEDLRKADRMGYQVDDIKVTKTGLAVHLTPRP